MTVGVAVPFYTTREMDDLTHEELMEWLLKLNRCQREYCARVNGRARSMLNATYRLNRWLDQESRDDIMDRHYALQVFKKIWRLCLIKAFIYSMRATAILWRWSADSVERATFLLIWIWQSRKGSASKTCWGPTTWSSTLRDGG